MSLVLKPKDDRTSAASAWSIANLRNQAGGEELQNDLGNSGPGQARPTGNLSPGDLALSPNQFQDGIG
jgi:hypothetical protein